MRGGWCAPHKACSWTKATQHRPTDSLSSKGAPGHDSLPAHLCCADAPTLAAAHRSLHGRFGDNTLPARSSTVKDMREESLNLPKQQALQLWRCVQRCSQQ
jgi:hypothetical protein